MNQISFDELARLATDPGNGWSIGTFGAIGEFIRDEDEPATIRHDRDVLEIVTARGGLQIKHSGSFDCLAWDSLCSDGETWGHAMALCAPRPESVHRVVRSLAIDSEAIRKEDRSSRLFDLGVCTGVVAMCVRTTDEGLISALQALEGQDLLSSPTIMAEMLRAQPHRVMLSPAGRIEVYQTIPAPDGKSPEGPHTHLLAKLINKDRAHGSNVPIPKGLQSVLNVHPRSPWRNSLGERHDFAPVTDAAFAPVLERFGLEEDHAIDQRIRAAVANGENPEFADWPETRRGRTKARIVLRRLAAAGDERAAPWRAWFDRTPIETEEGENL